MSKSMSSPDRVGVVSLVEPDAFRSYTLRARLTLLVSTAVGAVLGAIVGAPTVNPFWGFVLGGAVGFTVGLVSAVVVAVWPVLRVLWHWAGEITAALLVTGVGTLVSSWVSPWVTVALVVIVASAVGVLPGWRRWVRAWAWCVIVRHRLRLSFAAFIRARNRIHVRGASPLILWARPTPAGERVWVWLRPGLDLAEVESHTSKLAVSCWASEVRVMRSSEHHAALVRVDITRRDPLTDTVTSPLLRLVPTDVSAPTAVVGDALGGLDLDDVPAPTTLPRPARGGSR